jgi:hypothetical protein
VANLSNVRRGGRDAPFASVVDPLVTVPCGDDGVGLALDLIKKDAAAVGKLKERGERVAPGVLPHLSCEVARASAEAPVVIGEQPGGHEEPPRRVRELGHDLVVEELRLDAANAPSHQPDPISARRARTSAT